MQDKYYCYCASCNYACKAESLQEAKQKLEEHEKDKHKGKTFGYGKSYPEIVEGDDMITPETQAAHSGTCPSDCSASRLLAEVLAGLSVNGCLGRISVVYHDGQMNRDATLAMMDQIDDWRARFAKMQNDKAQFLNEVK